MPRDIRERRLALRDAVILVGLAEQKLRARLVRIGVKDKIAGGPKFSLPSGKAPAGDDPRQRRHVRLGVAAAEPERMQFHDFAGEVLIQAALAILPGAGVRTE
jgi:hypothetical protein